jgi:hypothetical protein
VPTIESLNKAVAVGLLPALDGRDMPFWLITMLDGSKFVPIGGDNDTRVELVVDCYHNGCHILCHGVEFGRR